VPNPKSKRTSSNFFQRTGESIRRLVRETVGELRKVSWPSRQEAFNLTKIVLIVIFATSFILGLLDIVFARLFAWLIAL
jgi:preprotein translocase subunit SecE